MKRKLFLTMLVLGSLTSMLRAQEKVERFCKVYVTYWSEKKQSITLNLGNVTNSMDSAEVNKLMKVNDFKNDVDVLTYMNSIGWKFLFNQTNTNSSGYYELFLRKNMISK